MTRATVNIIAASHDSHPLISMNTSISDPNLHAMFGLLGFEDVPAAISSSELFEKTSNYLSAAERDQHDWVTMAIMDVRDFAEQINGVADYSISFPEYKPLSDCADLAALDL